MSDNHWLRIPPEMRVDTHTTWTIAVSSDQSALGSSFILLNRPCDSITRLTAAEWMDLHSHMQRVERALDDLLSPDTYDHAFLRSRSRQMYIQVVPRYRSPRTWLGQTFEDAGWAVSTERPQRSLSSNALRELRDAIRNHLPVVV